MWSFFSRDPTKDFPYEIGDVIPGSGDIGLWKLHKGKKKGNGDEVSIFVVEAKGNSQTVLDLAKDAAKRLKTLRHPSILTYVDSLESDRGIFLVTERVEPLHISLAQGHRNKKDELQTSWGLFQITRAITFLLKDGNLRHCNLNAYSVFVNNSGEWKLSGFEYVCSATEGGIPTKINPYLERYDPPEKGDVTRSSKSPKWSGDVWGLGCLVWEAYNGPLKNPQSLKDISKLPKSVCNLYCEMVSSNPISRPEPSTIISRGRESGSAFKTTLVDALLFLEEIQLKENPQVVRFAGNLVKELDSFPVSIQKYKILPQMTQTVAFGNTGSSLLPCIFKLGTLLDSEEYQRKIVPCVIQLFSSPDRATRVRLLQQLEQLAPHLTPVLINDKIFPSFIDGFSDSNPTLREQTVKSVLHIAPKLNYQNLNIELMKHFARIQSKDEQGGIRTNSTVCLGKMAPFLHPEIRQKVLVSAFVRAMKDPFPPARIAGILAIAATQQFYVLTEVIGRILPSLCTMMLDPEKEVREVTFRTTKSFIAKLEKISEDPSLKENFEAEANAEAVAGGASSWAGWAVSKVTKFYRSPTPDKGNKVEVTDAVVTSDKNVTTVPKQLQEKKADTESTSEFEEGWDDEEDWGDMETKVCVPNNDKMSVKEEVVSSPDGWDVEDWISTMMDKPSRRITSAASYNWGESTAPDPFALISPVKETVGWEETEWEPIETTNDGLSKTDEAKRQREEKRIQRQKQLEAKRAQRAGPLKLGAKRLG